MLLCARSCRGKKWEYSVIHPDGRTEVILSVPKYDFNWQTSYIFATPLKLAKGSKIRAIAHYDNSAQNPRNPGPDQEVTWGPQSWNEMFLPFLELSVDDRDLRFDRLQEQLGR